MDRTTENDPIILYDTEEKNSQVIAGSIRASLEQRSLMIYLPQMEALPGSNVINNLNSAMAKAEVILILISRRPQRGGDFDLLIKQATRHSTNTIIPVFSGLSREEADALCDDYLYLRTVTPCFTGDDVFLDALHNGILQPHCLEKENRATYEKLESDGSPQTTGSFSPGVFSSKIFVLPVCHAKRMQAKEHTLDEDLEKQNDIFDILETVKSGDRIMIHAMAGMGKTYLARHIVGRWLQEDPKLTRFKYVFLLRSRLIHNHNEVLERVICHDLKIIPDSLTGRVRLMLKFNSSPCLILIDGFDELNDDQKDVTVLNKIISGEVGKNAVVVVTSRPERTQDIRDLTGGNYIDLPLQKLNTRGMLTFVNQCFPEIEDRGIFEKVSKVLMVERHSFVPDDLSSIPLFLSMICYMCKREIDKTGTISKFKELRQISRGATIATFWVLLIDVKTRKKSDNPQIFHSLKEGKFSPVENLLLDALAKMSFNCLGSGVSVFTEDILRDNKLDREAVANLGPIEMVSGGMVFFHNLFQEYAAAYHMTQDESALTQVLTALKSRHEPGSNFSNYKDSLILAAGIDPNILQRLSGLELNITVLVTPEPSYVLDLSLESAIVYEGMKYDDVAKKFIAKMIEYPVNKLKKTISLPEIDRRAYKYFLARMEYKDCLKLIWEVHLLLAAKMPKSGKKKTIKKEFTVACVPVISPMDKSDFQAIRDPILLSVLPSVNLGSTKRLDVFCTKPSVLKFLAEDHPSVGADLDEIIILPGSALAAWQLSVLAYKLSSKGSKRLRTIRILSRSTIYPRYNKVDETKLTIGAANVDCLSVENNISIDMINRLTQYMRITKLRFKSCRRSFFNNIAVFGGCSLFWDTKESRTDNEYKPRYTLRGVQNVEMDNVRGVSSLYKRVCAEDVKKVTVVNQAVRIIWDKENECWIHRGQDYLKSEDLKTIFPKAAIVTPYDRRHQDRYQEHRADSTGTIPLEPFTTALLKDECDFYTDLKYFKNKYYKKLAPSIDLENEPLPDPDDRTDGHTTEEAEHAVQDTAEDGSDGMGAAVESRRAVNQTLDMVEDGSNGMGATTASPRTLNPTSDMAKGGTDGMEHLTSLNVADQEQVITEDVECEMEPRAPSEELCAKISELSLKDE